MPIPGCFQYCSFVVEFEVRDFDASRSFLLHRIVLVILGFLLFHMKLSTLLSRSVKNFFCDFDGHCIESVGSMISKREKRVCMLTTHVQFVKL